MISRESTSSRSEVWDVSGQMYSLPEVGKVIWGRTAEEFTCCLSLIEVRPWDTNPQHFQVQVPGSSFAMGRSHSPQHPGLHLGVDTEGVEASMGLALQALGASVCVAVCVVVWENVPGRPSGVRGAGKTAGSAGTKHQGQRLGRP